MSYENRIDRSRSPVVRTEVLGITRWIDVSGGADVWRAVSFEHAIHWLRDTEACAVVLDADGRVCHEGPTYNDFYGTLTSWQEPLESRPDLMRRFGITGPNSPLSLEIRVIVVDKPRLPLVSNPPADYAPSPCYRIPPDDWFLDGPEQMMAWRQSRNIRGERDSALRPRRIDAVTVFEGPIWTSRDTPAEQAARFNTVWDSISEDVQDPPLSVDDKKRLFDLVGVSFMEHGIAP